MTENYLTETFTYLVNANDATIKVAYDVAFALIRDNNGTPYQFYETRIGANMRVKVMYRQQIA